MAKDNEVTINFTGDINDLNKAFSEVTNKLKGVSKEGDGLGKSIGGAFKNMEGLATGSFSSIASNFMSLVTNPITLGVAGIGAAVIAAFNFAKIGEENDKISKNFALFAEQAGFNAENLKGRISGIADGFVDLEEVLPKAQEAIVSLGTNAGKIPQIFELARNIGVATGRDINEVFTQLTAGVANGNDKMLRNNMIRIDSKKIEEDYANSLGVSVNRLSDAERQQARLNAVLNEGKKNFGQLGEDAVPIQSGIRKIGLAFDDVKDAIAAIINSKLGEYFAVVVSDAAKGIKSLADSINLMSGNLGDSGTQIERLEKHLAGLQKVQEGFFANPTMHEAYRKQIDDTIAKIDALKQKSLIEDSIRNQGATEEAIAIEKKKNEEIAKARMQGMDATLAIKAQEQATIAQMETDHNAAMDLLALEDDATRAEKQAVIFENQKANNEQAYQNEIEKNKLIKDDQQKLYADKLALAKKDAADQKTIDTKLLQDKQQNADFEKAIRQGNFQAAQNFMQAGLILAKEGSAEQKALLIGQAIMNTYLVGTAALAPPPNGLGPLFGIPLAASTVAIGLANVAKISGAKDGAFVTSGMSGVDTEPFMLAKGEIVAPEKSYDSVIDGELRSRGYVPKEESKELEPQTVINLTINTDVIADDNSINKLVERIRDSIRYNGASLA